MNIDRYITRVTSNAITCAGFAPGNDDVLVAGIDQRTQRLAGVFIGTYVDPTSPDAFDGEAAAIIDRLEKHGATYFVVEGFGPEGRQRALDTTKTIDAHRSTTTIANLTVSIDRGQAHMLNVQGEWTVPLELNDLKFRAALSGVDLAKDFHELAGRYVPQQDPEWRVPDAREQRHLDALTSPERAGRANDVVLSCISEGGGTARDRSELATLMRGDDEVLELVAAKAGLNPDAADVLHHAFIASPIEDRAMLGAAAGYAHLVAYGSTLGARLMSHHVTGHARANDLAALTDRMANSTMTVDDMRQMSRDAVAALEPATPASSLTRMNALLDRAVPITQPEVFSVARNWRLPTVHDRATELGALNMGPFEYDR